MAEKMTHYERIIAAYNIEEGDRVPCAPINLYIIPYLAGMSIREGIFQAERLVDAYIEHKDLLGDSVHPYMTAHDHLGLLGRAGWDQTTLDWRVFEHFPPEGNVPNLYEKDFIEDYNDVLERGFSTIMFNKKLENNIFEKSVDDFLFHEFEYPAEYNASWKRFVETTGIPLMLGARSCHPLDLLQYYRGIMNLTMDIYERPDEIHKLMDVMADYEAVRAMDRATKMGAGEVPGAETICFINGAPPGLTPDIFDAFYFPCAKKMIDLWINHGFKVQCHWDNDLTHHLKTIRKLADGVPKGRIIMDFEKTNMKQAKKEIGDVICLYGNVPSAMLVYGSVTEVEDYCKQLIKDCAEGGGFILAAECETPWDSKPENIRTMVETAKKYGQYK
ncbi:MAG: hypothetical protein JRH15_23250 [Deltaproteobacteria bacterium]|nr:hypothetical protein [Deltaproteobacteria bacterium]